MPSSPLAQVLRDAQALSPEDQARLRASLETWLHPAPAALAEAAFEDSLLRQGIVSHLPSPTPAPDPTLPRTRITLQGPPLSATLIEERR